MTAGNEFIVKGPRETPEERNTRRLNNLLYLVGYDDLDPNEDMNGEEIVVGYEKSKKVDRYLLMQNGHYGEGWNYLFRSMKQAAQYVDSDDALKDNEQLYDLDSDRVYFPSTSTTWSESG